MDLGLKGLRALVTGGTKGIGRRCADLFAEEGAHVAICARNAAEVEETVKALEASGVTAFGRALDVADKAAIEAWVGDAAAALGGIDMVVGNVSALAIADDEAAWEAGFQTDLMHSVRLVNAAMPWLGKSAHPSITFVSSVSARDVDITGPAYAGMKAVLVRYAKDLAWKHAAAGIRANCVSPGNTYFKGGIWNWVEENQPETFAAQMKLNPTGRFATPEEIARGVVFIASPASSFTTGINFVIDGALSKGIHI
jgi:3-oxoacyl-[acyl-carrier protein] reductase